MIPHYITAVAMQALVAGGRAADKPTIEKARQYLADHLLDEGEGIAKSDKFYGGMGYGGTSDGGIADIISLEYSLRAMKEAELPANDAAWQKAITFLQRTQNNKETNDQGWSRQRRRLHLLPRLQPGRRHDAVVRQRHLRRPPRAIRGPTCRRTIAACRTR